MFDLNNERNIPTYFSTLLWLGACALTALIAALKKKEKAPFYKQWIGIAFICLFLSIDENISIHELFNRPMKELHDFKGIFTYSWTIPYIAFLSILAVLYFKFILHLPRKILWLLLLSGGIFISGAIGLEMLGGQEKALNGNTTLFYLLCATIEEILEMLGVSLYIYTMLSYIEHTYNKLTISIAAD